MINLSSSVQSVSIFPVPFKKLELLLSPIIYNLESKQIKLNNKRVVGYTFGVEDFDALGEFFRQYKSTVSYSGENLEYDIYAIEGNAYTVKWFVKAKNPVATVTIDEKHQV